MSGETLLDVFEAQLERSRGRMAFRHRLGGAWRTTTWGEWDVVATEAAAGLCALGVAAGDRVAILSSTRLGWVEADLGILRAGAITVPLYPTLLADGVAQILRDAGTRVVIAEDPSQVEKLLPLLGRELDHVVVFDRVRRLDTPDASGRLEVRLDDTRTSRIIVWSDFLESGRARLRERPDELRERRAAITPQTVASIVYTSGTGGDPKGVVLTHDNFVFEADALRGLLPLGTTDEQLLVLPLAHIFGKLTLVMQMRIGYATAFSESILRVVEDCAEVKPTFLASVPRLFEKMHETILHASESGGEMRRRLWDWAVGVGRRVSELRRRGREPSGVLAVEWRYARKIVFAPIHQRLGGRMRFMISGAAPLAKEIAELFHAADLLILEGYGLTETTGAATVNLPHRFRFGTVGPAIPGVRIRIAGDGEILVHGRSVMREYWGKPDDSREAIDAEGWLHTGDIGRVDSISGQDGFLTITDRKKDLIVTAGGKNVAPQRIEAQLEQSRLVSRAVVIGDRRPHLVALIALDEPAVRAWAKEQGLSGDWSALVKHPTVRDRIAADVDDVNARLAGFDRVRKFALLDRELSPAHGELTPTGKVKRAIVARRWAAEIDALYTSNEK